MEPKAPLKRHDFTQSQLYKLNNKKRLAALLHLSSNRELESLLRAPNIYKKFPIEKNGKVRHVETPNRLLMPVHIRLFRLLNRIILPDYLHSGVKGRSYLTNAKAHLGQVEAYTLDVRAFYPSVTRSKVARFFRDTMLCDIDIAAILADLTTCDNHIPTGSPLSQLLAYLACKDMFDGLHDVSSIAGLRFTCYVDDLTFSGDKISKVWMHSTIKPIIRKAGLKSHKDKHFKEGQAKNITGVILKDDALKVSNRMHYAVHGLLMELAETTDTATLNSLYAKLIGKLSAAGQIEERFIDQRVKVTQRRRQLRISSKKAAERMKAGNKAKVPSAD